MLPLYAVIYLSVLTTSLVPFLLLTFHTLRTPVDLSLLFRPEILRSVFDTLWTAAAATLLASAIMVPISWTLVRTNAPYKKFFEKALSYPYFIPPYLFAGAWVLLAVPNIGFLNRLFPGNVFNIYSSAGLIWVFVTAYAPIILIAMTTQLQNMDPSLEEASRICGAGPLRTFLRITLPCLWPSVSSSALLFALTVMAAFGVPGIVGNPARIYVLTTKIYTETKMGGLAGVTNGFLISLWLLFFTGLLLWWNALIAKHSQVALISGKAARPSEFSLSRLSRGILFVALFLLTIFTVLLPLGAIILGSFSQIAGTVSWSNLTLENYRYLLATPETARAFWNSFTLATGTSLACTTVGFLICYFKDRLQLPGADMLTKIASTPFAVPGTVVALALIVAFGMTLGNLALLGSLWLIAFAYFAKYAALSIQTVSPALNSIGKTMDEAARICGASRWKVLSKILLPLMRSTLAGVFLLTALPLLTELTMTVLLSGPGTETLGTLMFQLQEYANPLASCALATCVLLLLSALLGLESVIRRRGQI